MRRRIAELEALEGKRKRAEESLRRERDFVESLIETAQVIVLVLGAQGQIVRFNRYMEKISSYRLEEVRGKDWFSTFLPGRDQDRLRQLFLKATGGTQTHGNINSIVTKDGREREIEWHDTALRDQQGQVTGLLSIGQDVTERRLAEKERLRLANYVRLLLDSTDEGIYAFDLIEQCTLVNRSGAEMAGYEPAEMLGKNMHLLLHHSRPDGSPYPVDECPIAHAIRAGQGVRVDTDVFWKRDGTSFPVEYSSYPIIEDGVVKGAVVSFIDITERKRMEDALRKARDELEVRVQERTAELARANRQLRTEVAERKRAEETLRESEMRFRKVFEEGPLGIAMVDRNYRFVKVNPMLCRIIGYTEQELTTRTFVDFTYPEDVERSVQAIGQLYKGEIPYIQIEKRYVRKTGEIIWVSITSSIIRDADGRPLYHLAMFQDITERKQADEERERLLAQLRNTNQQLTASNQQTREQAGVAGRRARELETIIESIADGVFLCSIDGRIVEVNRAGLRLIGLTKKEEALRPLVDYLGMLDLRHPDGRKITLEGLALYSALHGEAITGYEEITRSLQTNKDVYLLVSAAPVRDQDGRIVGAVEVMSDITELRELDKLKDEFIFVAAHELKTPVAIMKGYAQALERTAGELIEPRRKMLDAIDRGADRINGIVQDLVDISRIHLGQLELVQDKVDLTGLVEEVVNRMALTADRHRIRVAKEVPVIVRGDRERLGLVLTNLIDNAILYSPSGGDIDVAVIVQNHQAVVSVADQGVGIPKEKQKRIFERFYRAHTGTPQDYGGMGVGLYISREVIKRHGGQMWFESEAGKGSTFYFNLPLEGEYAR